jgi:hypothetical protein
MNIRQLRKNIKISIQFNDTEDAAGMTFALMLFSEVFSCLSSVAKFHIANCYESNIRSEFSDGISTEFNLKCGRPYDECLCSNRLNNSSNLTNCVPYVELMASRISPSILFILESIVVWKLFSFNANCPHIIVRILWILSILISVGIAIGTYLKSCFHYNIFLVIQVPRMFLWPSTIYNIHKARECESGGRRYNHTLAVRRRELPVEYLLDNGTIHNNEIIHNNGAKSLRELL